jgi:hypothetical protein
MGAWWGADNDRIKRLRGEHVLMTVERLAPKLTCEHARCPLIHVYDTGHGQTERLPDCVQSHRVSRSNSPGSN